MSDITLGSLFDGIGGFPFAGSFYGITPVWASEIEAAPIRITKRHFPDMLHLGDILKMKGDEIPPVDIVSFGSPCFPAGTMILTERGYINIEDVVVGDKVLTHKNRWRTVTAVGHRESETIKLKGNIDLETTANHPIYSADIKKSYLCLPDGKHSRYKSLINIGEWTPAENMAHKQWATPMTADKLEVPVERRCTLRQKALPEMNSAFWYFVGRWLGDGWVRDSIRKERPTGKGVGGILLCDSESKLQELIDTVKPISSKFCIAHERTAVKVRFTSQLLCKWLVKHFGKGAGNKRIPGFVYGLDWVYRSQLLKGILDSDGYKVRANRYVIQSISKVLILGVRLLAESLGFSTSITHQKNSATHIIEGRIVNQKDTYILNIIFNPNRRTGLPHDGHKWYLCRSATPTNTTKTVYNISVDEDESYIADSIVVHNCQSLSVAGQQAGINLHCPSCNHIESPYSGVTKCPVCGEILSLTESGLFLHAIRLVKEMREATNGEYPKIIIFENVSGALSSNNGNDFYCVLKEFCGLMGERLPDSRPAKWPSAGEILAESCSLAWRTFDAQYWGVPQRRRRIFLVADLTGQRARDILFKRESLRRHTPKSEEPWKSSSRKAKESIGNTDRAYTAESDKPLAVATQQVNTAYGICSLGSNCMKSDNPDSGFYEADVARTLDCNGGNPSCNQGGNVVVSEPVYCIQGNCIDRADTAGCNGKGWTEDLCYTLTTIDRPAVAYSVHENQRAEVRLCEDKAFALTTGGGKPGQGVPVVFGESSFGTFVEGKFATLKAQGGCLSGGSETFALQNSVVRRLTPTECERLQGFPDGWTEGESDAARYKALGNSVAIPCVAYIMSGIADALDPEE